MPESTTPSKQITTQLSTQQVELIASQPEAVFYATVYNGSDRFASFQLKLLAAGVATTANQWYRLMPSASAKIPAGDCSRFQIEIFDLPPIAQQFRGSIDLTVEVTSWELGDQYDNRQTLQLLVQGLQNTPPDLTLMVSSLEAKPGERVAIVSQVHNPTSAEIEITLRLQELPDFWFPDGVQQTLLLPAGALKQVTFPCYIPPSMQTLSRSYDLKLEATGRFPTVDTSGQLHILPAGEVFFDCNPLAAIIPKQLGRWQNPTQGTAEFKLQFDNQANVEPAVQIQVRNLQPPRRRWFWQNRDAIAVSPDSPPPALPPEVAVGAFPAALPIASSTIPLTIHRKLPWLGWARSQRYEVTAASPTSPLPIQNDRHTLQIRVFPVIPFWLQLLGALLLLAGILAWFLLNKKHSGPVTSVQFSVLSGSEDQTIWPWRVDHQSLYPQKQIGGFDKAVRVVRYSPKNTNQVAIGFENGEIQFADLSTGTRSPLIPDKDDRVFDLVFSRDASTLYSAHGSGLVLQWDITSPSKQTTLQQAYDTKFAIKAMALTSNVDGYLAIGGQYNRLLLLKTQPGNHSGIMPAPKSTQFLNIQTYPPGTPTDYISSLSTAKQKPNLLAVADTQGHLSLWNTQQCLQNGGRCEPIDRLWLGHAGSPIRSVALSANGCFMVSGGDDGQLKLWALDGQGMRRSNALEGRIVLRADSPLNAVDIKQTDDAVWVTSGGDDERVRLERVPLEQNNSAGEHSCPKLAGGES